MSHPAHLIRPDGLPSPSALIPFCIFKSDIKHGRSGTSHPNLSFPVCSSFVPDILEGQLCQTIRLNEKIKKGPENALGFLIDINNNRNFRLLAKQQKKLNSEQRTSYTAAKTQINVILPEIKYSTANKAVYRITAVKKMAATKAFLEMSRESRKCDLKYIDECKTNRLLAKCGCVPWEMKDLHKIDARFHSSEVKRRKQNQHHNKGELAGKVGLLDQPEG